MIWLGRRRWGAGSSGPNAWQLAGIGKVQAQQFSGDSSGGVVRVRVQRASSKAAYLCIHSFITYFLPGAYFSWGLVQW